MSAPGLGRGRARDRSVEWLAQADLLLLLARLLRPARNLAEEELLADRLRGQTHDLARASRLGAAIVPALNAISAALASESPGRRAGDLTHLFDAPGQCPPNETAWVRRDKGAILGDIAGFYAAFGFAHSNASHEKADHVVTELEYLGLLLVMRAQARARGERRHERTTSHALRRFAADHAGEWLPAIAERLGQTAQSGVLRAAAVLLAAVWDGLCHRQGWERPSLAAAPSPCEAGTPYECELAREGAPPPYQA